MTHIIWYSAFTIPTGIEQETRQFIKALSDDTATLHTVPGAAAPDVRLVDVGDHHSAVVFLTEGYSGASNAIPYRIVPRDEAENLATTVTLNYNPRNSVTEFRRVPKPDAPAQAEEQAAPEAPAASESTASGAPEPVAVDPEELADVLGVDPQVARRVAEHPEAVPSITEGSPAWEKEAIAAVLAGTPAEQVREDLGLTASKAVDADGTGDKIDGQTLIDGMTTEAARMDFYVDRDETERDRVLSGGSLENWRVHPHPSQHHAITAQFQGSGRVIGGAGTGKTVVLLHRALRLATADSDNPPRVFLGTFNAGLAEALVDQMTILDDAYPEAKKPGDPGIFISSIDKLIRRVIDGADLKEVTAAASEALMMEHLDTRPAPLGEGAEEDLWQEAAMKFEDELPPEKTRPEFLSQEYSEVILGGGLKEQRDYLRAKRTGRGMKLSRAERKMIWQIVESFSFKCALQGKATYPALATLAAEILHRRKDEFLFDHVLVDEGQDLHAGHWRFLRACVGEHDNDIFLAEDSHQRIYGRRLTLSNYGISTRGRASIRLKVNYRTTAETLGYAQAILEGLDEKAWRDSEDEPDSLTGYHSVYHGPSPRFIKAASAVDEAEKLVPIIEEWTKQENVAVGILVRTKNRRNQVERQLEKHGIVLNTVRAKAEKEGSVTVLTMHSAKGRQFTHVALLDAGENAQPARLKRLGKSKEDIAASLQRERALYYVAASRAREELVVSVIGEPSPLLPS